jgi:hypothetical protein
MSSVSQPKGPSHETRTQREHDNLAKGPPRGVLGILAHFGDLVGRYKWYSRVLPGVV